ncbi:MAG: DUF5719 family protein [Actinomycetota bacterium]
MTKRLTAIVIAIAVAASPAVLLSPAVATGSPSCGGSIGTWQRSAAGGFGAGKTTTGAVPLVVFGNELYVGVADSAGCSVRKKVGGTWPVVGQAGLGDPDNTAVTSFAVYDGSLYAGTTNTSDGCRVLRLESGNWVDVAPPGFGDKANMSAATMLAAGDGKLYVGTANLDMSSFQSNGAEIHSWDGAAWSAGSEIPAGFGDTENEAVSAMAEYDGKLYAGTTRMHITVEVIDLTHATVTLTSRGCQLWRRDGATWATRTRVANDGLTDVRNVAITDLEVYNGRLHMGTLNGDGQADVSYDILSGDITISDLTYDTDGLSVYDYDGEEFRQVVQGGFDSVDDFTAGDMTTTTVGTRSLLLMAVGRAEGTGRLKAYDGTYWFSAADDGFGDAANSMVASLRSFGGKVYAGTANTTEGCEVWSGQPPEQKGDLSKTWYLAEGSTNGGFETWVLIANPNDQVANAALTYMTPTGQVQGPDVTLEALSRTSLFVADSVPSEWSVSTLVTCDQPVVVERSMYWKDRKAGHDSIGVTSPAPEWYLAEGSTNGGFETWVLIQNPGASEAQVQLTFMTPEGEVEGPALDIPAMSRRSVDVADTVPDEWDVSTKVTGSLPVIAERAVYWNERGGGHDSVGVTTPSSSWYLAEGCTNGGFETWVLVQNPGTLNAHTKLSFMTPEGLVPGPEVDVPPSGRVSVEVAETVPDQWSVSTKVEADHPVIAERSMYWDERVEGHNSTGVGAAQPTWNLAEGSTNGGFETWVLVQNPGGEAATVRLTYMTPAGEVAGPVLDLGANSRTTVNVADTVPGEWSVSTTVSSNRPVIAERAVYWNDRRGGHDSIGAVI